MNRINRLAPYVLGLVFVATGILKILDPAAFAFSVARLRIVPMAMVGPIAILLPWIELVAGVALFIPKLQISALKLTMASESERARSSLSLATSIPT